MIPNKFYKSPFSIVLILIVAIIPRVIKIFSPIIGAHSWRQADTAAIARNFYEYDMNILYPRIDWGGNTAGLVECEFPIYQYLLATVYSLFGVDIIFGRFLSIIFSLLTLYFIFKLILEFQNSKVAFWTTLLYAMLPLNIFYGRVVMPEPLLVLAISSGFYFYVKWLKNDKIYYYFISLLLISIACLIKPPTLYIGLPMSFLAYKKFGKYFFIKPKILIYATFILLVLTLWYFHAHQLFQQSGNSFGIWGYGTDKWGNWSFVLTFEFWNGVIFRNVAEKHLSWGGFVLLIVALISFRKDEMMKVFYWWSLASLIYLIIVAKGNYYHDYYQIPIILPLTVFIAKAIIEYINFTNLKSFKTISIVILCIVMIGISIFRLDHYFAWENISIDDKYKLALLANQITDKDDLIIVVAGFDPMVLYNAHRKGWHANYDEFTVDYINQKIEYGADYIFIVKSYFRDDGEKLKSLTDRYQPVYDDQRILGLSLH